MRCILLLCAALLVPSCALAGSLPPILASNGNSVPACVTPERLMQFVAARNDMQTPRRVIEPRFTNIAALYQRLGTCVARAPEACAGVRWDYAFFQMVIETNWLTFVRPDGGVAGVPARDNNFAGVGATRTGKPGEAFKDVPTGVLAHLQHVLMYSTTRVPEPVAKRTRLVQGDVQDVMRRLGRPVTFGDLARVWTGTDRNTYGATMLKLSERYSERFCGPNKDRVASVR